MIVVFPYSLKDQEQARRCADWILELEGTDGLKQHKVLIVKDHRVDQNIADRIHARLCLAFGSGETLKVEHDAYDHWPESCNLMFAMAARHIGESPDPKPWLWLEPDAIPLRKGWLDALEAEYKQARKEFMGDRVDVNNVPVHMSGVGIYPPRLIEHAGVALISQEVAWDVMAADQIVPKMHDTKLIEHAWKHPTFDCWKTVEREVDLANAVLFHSSKDGSLIERLREEYGYRVYTSPRLSGQAGELLTEPYPGGIPPSQKNLSAAPVLAEPKPKRAGPSGESELTEQPNVVGSGQLRESTTNRSQGSKTRGDSRGGGQFICDILIKTYPKDYEWLNYCLRGLEKFATGFRKIIIVYPENTNAPVFDFSVQQIPTLLVTASENGNPYLFQQAVKFSAHEWTDAPYILHIDSDTVPCAPFSPSTFFRDNRPLWLMTPYSLIQTPWQVPTEKFLGEPVEFEFMRRFPIITRRSLHAAAAWFCQQRHQKSATEYIVSQPDREFSEFNALGALAYYGGKDTSLQEGHPYDFYWLNTQKEELPPLVAIQSWSHGGLTNELRQQFETILSGGDAVPAVEASTSLAAASSAQVSFTHETETQTKERIASDKQPPSERETGHVGRVSPNVSSSRDIAASGFNQTVGIHQTKEGWWVIDGDTHISKWVEEEGRLDHDQWGLQRILPEINEGDTVVDAGAFIGDHAIAYLKAVGKDGHVICFEPHPLALECLKRNCPKAEIFGMALSDTNKSYFFEPTPNAGASTIVDAVTATTVSAALLDSFGLDRLDYFKIDVEGHELAVLKGATDTIDRFKPKLLIEINKWALLKQDTEAQHIFDWLRVHEYRWQSLQPLHIADPPQYDVLCRPLTREAKIKKQIPWASPLHSQDEIRHLVARLKEFTDGHAAARIRFVRQELVLAGVIDRPAHYNWTTLRKKKNARKRRLKYNESVNQ